MRYSLLLLMALMVLSLGIHYAAEQDHAPVNPGRDLHEMTLRDPDLGQALADADKGDITGLTTWLNRAESADREHLGNLLYAMLLKDPSQKIDDPDMALCWKYRNRFRAFINLSTGNDRLDITIDNLLAYTLVTGTPTPSEADINLARSLELRLKREAKDNSDDSLEDTVACIEFTAKNYAAAQDAWKLCLSWHAQAHDPAAPDFGKLYQRRLAAATRNVQAVAAHKAEPGGDGADAGLDLVGLPGDDDAGAAAPKPSG